MKMNKMIPISLILLVGCSMVPSRTYLSEMENEDDASFFQPKEDFPVVRGDSGRSWRTNKEIRRRTPATVQSQRESQEKQILKDQLVALESKQTDEALDQYQQYKARLGSNSERIYFLQIPSVQERAEYLASRDLLNQPLYNHLEKRMAAQQSDLLMTMNKEEVMDSWGHPDRIDVAGNPIYENERWVYQKDGSVKYIYFESGVVQGWTTERK